MPKTVKRTEHIWVFGKREDFAIYDCGVPLDARQYMPGVHRQKNQIVLHFTAGNGPASGSVGWWNTIAPIDSALFYCPKYFDAPHVFSSPTPGVCPLGHGNLKHLNNRASAHYVVEKAWTRLSAAQPYVDIAEVVDSDTVTWHGEVVNTNSIGIEHANAGEAWSVASHDTFTGNGAAKRPTDRNHWLHINYPTDPNSNLTSHDFQAYEEEQYRAMIMLLRYLCIKHRIPRRFLGDTTREKMARYWPNRDAPTLSKLMRFRGILSHMNCHKDKECGGPAMHRNRLFRGIIDEWWLPVDVDGNERPYHMGPFDPQTNAASYFRWQNGTLTAELFHDANLDALQETRSYYDLDRTQFYYAKTEDPVLGGTFPIGTNKVWHGGVHFASPLGNPKVYAAASGTIVAARLGSNDAIEKDPDLGSQRFALIRHCVYWRQEADPGGGQRTAYGTAAAPVDPTYFFTLYMHLAPFANLTAADNQNPPWFNYWLRNRAAAADANAVFCPNVPVSVGDWIGQCGIYRTKQMLHFEVMAHDELTVAPWNDANHRIVDTDSNVICDSAALNQFVSGARVTLLDILRAATELRKVKSFHKSEWALADASSLTPVLPDAAARNSFWNKIKYFMWVADAVAACPDLSTQLCDANGMMWHYHPVTFMDFVNQLVLRENGKVSPTDYSDTNVEMEDEFLTKYVTFHGSNAVPAAADIKPVRPFSISLGPSSNQDSEYHFTRLDLACRLAAPHNPADNPPKETHFHFSLLDVLENVRMDFAQSVNVSLSYVCPAHNVAAQVGACVLGTAESLKSHASGLAVDIRPGAATQNSCKALWTSTRKAADVFHATCGEDSGQPSHGELQGHVQSVVVSTEAGVQAKLVAGTALTAPEIHAFVIHLELVESTTPAQWVCLLSADTKATSVRLSGGDVIGKFFDRASADSERLASATVPWAVTGGWESTIKKGSRATRVDVRPAGPWREEFMATPGIIGYFDNALDAEGEAADGHSWPEES